MKEYFEELKNIMLELPKALLHFITISTFGLFYPFYPKKWKEIFNEVDKVLYE